METLWDKLKGGVPQLPAPTFTGLIERLKTGGQALQPTSANVPTAPSVACCVEFDREQVFWSMRNTPARNATKHYLVTGATGAAKTTVIRLFAQSIAPRFRKDAADPEQLVVFDAKGDMIPILAGMGLGPDEENVWIMNPFDARSARWNVAESVQTPALARYLATLLVPEERNSNAPFFSDAARELVCAVIMGLNTVAGTYWTLRDLSCALGSKDSIIGVCRHNPGSEACVETLFEDDKHVMGGISTILTKVAKMESVAALWKSSKSGRVFSVPDFLKKPGVLVLGYDDTHKDSLQPLNNLLLRALTDEILCGPSSHGPRHWFVLDEFPLLKKADFVTDLLNRGRSKGASVLIGIQGIEGLCEHYGDNGMENIASNCAHKTFLHAGSPKTAEWAERYFGKVRFTDVSHTITASKEGTSQSWQYSTQDRSAFLASFFMGLPSRKGRRLRLGQ